jgi:uncharacterized protein with PQ loop repeat
MEAFVFALLAAVSAMISNVPQAWKVRHPNSTNDLHSWTVSIGLVSCILWSAYGFMLELYILGIESGIVGLLYLYILGAIVRDRYVYVSVPDLSKALKKEEKSNQNKKQHI